MASRPPERAAATAEAGTAEPIVVLRGITKRFPGVIANDDVSLSVYPAEVHALLGENGAGKSTLISILSGMQRPDRGTIEVRGRAMRIASPRTALDLGIGTVYQHPTLVPTLTVLENLILGASWRAPMNRAATRARLNEIAALLGIALPEDTPLGALSLGQQQLVEIVKALWRGEKVLILDEATSMLTPQGVEDLGRVIGRLRDAGIAVLFITHKLHEAVRFGDRVSVLRQGRKVGSLPPETLGRLSPQEAIDHIVDLMFGQAADRSGAERRRAQREAAPGEREVIAVDGLRPAGGPAAAEDGGVTFAVHEREIFGIAGVDGNGQKQLAEAIAGQRPAEAGRIVLDGAPIEGLSVRQRQHAGLRYVTDDRLGEGTVPAFPVGLNLLLKRIGDAPFWRHGIVQQRRGRAPRAHPDRRARRARAGAGDPARPPFGRQRAEGPARPRARQPADGRDLQQAHLWARPEQHPSRPPGDLRARRPGCRDDPDLDRPRRDSRACGPHRGHARRPHGRHRGQWRPRGAADRRAHDRGGRPGLSAR